MSRNRLQKGLLCLLALALCLTLFAGCRKETSDPPSVSGEATDVSVASNLSQGQPTKQRTEELLQFAPEQYAFALYVKIRSEFVLYLDDSGTVCGFTPLNEEAMQIGGHTNLDNFRVEDSVWDIFWVSTDDFEVDTEQEDIWIWMAESHRDEQATSAMLKRAVRALEEALKEKGLKGTVNYKMPEGMTFDPEAEFIAGPEGINPPSEEEPFGLNSLPNFEPSLGALVCANAGELESSLALMQDNGYWQDHLNVVLTGDFEWVVDPDQKIAFDFDCRGHSISISGTVGNVEGTGLQPLEIRGASFVDLSGIDMDLESAKLIPPGTEPHGDFDEEELYWKPERRIYDIVRIFGTPEDQIAFPGQAERQVDTDEKYLSVFDPVLNYDTSSDGGPTVLSLWGPGDEYESRKERDTQVLEQIIATGGYHDLVGSSSNNFYYIATDVTINVGDAYLPNRDYEALCIGKGAHVKLTGTLHITGGTFNIECWEYSGIDLTGLTIVKNHPSPDMIFIRYNPQVGLNTNLCYCYSPSGTVNYSMGEKLCISVW